MKSIKLLGLVALAGFVAIGSASAQDLVQPQQQQQQQTPYEMLHGYGKTTSSAHKYRETTLHPYDGDAAPQT